jgi:hypothetical protein
MRTHPYDGNWADSHPLMSRREILANEFCADTRRRRLFVDLTLILAPVLLVTAGVGFGVLAN